jgi:hypothetical protein
MFSIPESIVALLQRPRRKQEKARRISFSFAWSMGSRKNADGK